MTQKQHKHSQSKNTFIYITWITSADKNHGWPTLAQSCSADRGICRHDAFRVSLFSLNADFLPLHTLACLKVSDFSFFPFSLLFCLISNIKIYSHMCRDMFPPALKPCEHHNRCRLQISDQRCCSRALRSVGSKTLVVFFFMFL